MTSIAVTCVSDSPARTCEIAALIGARLAPGDVILLHGDVGAGKTHFARCLIQSQLAIPEDVPSPTYTLVKTYPGPVAEIWHADLYRLSGPDEIIELGLSDAFSDAICLIEWPDRLGPHEPPGALHLALAPGAADDARQLRFSASDPRWADILKGVCDDGP